jgi:hypothetical protein
VPTRGEGFTRWTGGKAGVALAVRGIGKPAGKLHRTRSSARGANPSAPGNTASPAWPTRHTGEVATTI